jgi:hypothetical protein
VDGITVDRRLVRLNLDHNGGYDTVVNPSALRLISVPAEPPAGSEHCNACRARVRSDDTLSCPLGSGETLCEWCYAVRCQDLIAEDTGSVLEAPIPPDLRRDPERGETEVERLTRERDQWRDAALVAQRVSREAFQRGFHLRHGWDSTGDRRRDANLRAVFGTAFPEEGE